MEWTDEAVVLSTRRHGETSVVLEAMTRDHGRHLGLVRGGRSKALQPVLQAGNAVRLVWRARLDEHLGFYAVEGLALHGSRLMASRLGLYAIGHLAGLTRLLAERDPHPAIHSALSTILTAMADETLIAPLVARFELAMLTELGFGLDLTRCASTGSIEDLVYLSPKSGRAVSRLAGEPWHDRLFELPPFLRGEGSPTPRDVNAAFRITGHFLDRDVFGPRGITAPEGRAAVVAMVRESAGDVA